MTDRLTSSRIHQIVDLVLRAAFVAVGLALSYFLIDHAPRTGTAGSIAVFYVAPAIVLLGLVAALRSTPDRKAAVALLVVFTAGPLYAIEGVLQVRSTLWTDYGIRTSVADTACPSHVHRRLCLGHVADGVAFDKRAWRQVFDSVEAEGVEIWPSLTAERLVDSLVLDVDGRTVVPLAPGVANVATLLCSEGEWIIYRSDERGFNNPPGLHVPDSVTVALVGDSQVHGWCLPEEQSIAARVRERIPATVNFGVEGSGPLTELATMREYVKPLRPEFVVWVYTEGNDPPNLRRELLYDALTGYLDPEHSQGLLDEQAALDLSLRSRLLALREFWDERERSSAVRRETRANALSNQPLLRWLKLRQIRQLPRTIRRGRAREVEEWQSEEFLAVFDRAKRDVEAWGGNLIVAIPTDTVLQLIGFREDFYRNDYMSAFEELEIPVINFAEIFGREPDPVAAFLRTRAGGHLNATATQVMADVIADTIEAMR